MFVFLHKNENDFKNKAITYSIKKIDFFINNLTTESYFEGCFQLCRSNLTVGFWIHLTWLGTEIRHSYFCTVLDSLFLGTLSTSKWSLNEFWIYKSDYCFFSTSHFYLPTSCFKWEQQVKVFLLDYVNS